MAKLKDAVKPPSTARVLLTLAPLLITIGGWIWVLGVYSERYATDAEVRQEIRERSPYLADRDRILRAISDYDQLRRDLVDLKYEIKGTNARLDLLLSEQGKGRSKR